jgi:potassium-transporting ATPase KdpC subunit
VDTVDEAGNPTGKTEPADPKDLALVASGASNLGPTNEAFLATVAERVQAYRKVNRLGQDTPVPVDAVTASGSGLDPHISIANARLQARRVAEARDMDLAQVLGLINAHTTDRHSAFWARRQ